MHIKQAISPFLLCLSLLLMTSTAGAVDYADGRIHINIYGTVGIATLSPDAEMFRSTGQAGPSLTNGVSADFDSRLGLQIEGDLADNVSLVWQGLLQKDIYDKTRVDTKWAYLKSKPVSWLDIKLGRFMTPFYQISDEMYVGYAHPWIRPPQEVYGLIGQVDKSDGLWMRLHLPTDAFRTSLDLSVSRFSDSQAGVTYKISPMFTSVLNVSWGGLSFRAMAARAPITLSGPFVTSTQALLSAPGAAYRYDVTGEKAWYYNIGFTYQDTEWYASAEYVRTDVNNNHAVGEDQAYTATLGHYWRELLPYIVYSRLQVLNVQPETGLTGVSLITAQSLIDSRKNDQSTVGVGCRWDFYPGFALKAQVDWVRVPSGHHGLFRTAPAGTENVYSMAVDWTL